uniref:Uncharacterized protein n=1 Tax=Oryza glumipatula TaxID=40148 RepID=A0A0E0AUF4_9ORYZ
MEQRHWRKAEPLVGDGAVAPTEPWTSRPNCGGERHGGGAQAAVEGVTGVVGEDGSGIGDDRSSGSGDRRQEPMRQWWREAPRGRGRRRR